MYNKDITLSFSETQEDNKKVCHDLSNNRLPEVNLMWSTIQEYVFLLK